MSSGVGRSCRSSSDSNQIGPGHGTQLLGHEAEVNISGAKNSHKFGDQRTAAKGNKKTQRMVQDGTVHLNIQRKRTLPVEGEMSPTGFLHDQEKAL